MSDTLHVGRHDVRYRVPRGGSAGGVRTGFDAALGSALLDPLSARQMADHDGVWLIRRLDVHACVGVSWSPRRIARAVAARVAGELTSTLDRGADGDTVLWFPDRPTFVAQYLVDCARGRAAGRWEYAALAGAGASSETSAALREVMVRESLVALAALAQLRAPDVAAVLAALSAPDAEVVLGSLAECGAGGGDPVSSVLAAVRRLIAAGETGTDRRAAALAIFVDVARHQAPPPGTAARARDAAALAVTIARAPLDDAERIAAAVELGDWRAFVRTAGARAMEAALGLAGWPPLARADLVRVMTDTRPDRTGDAVAAAKATTQLGGMFLLLPLLEELPWPAATATWPGLDGVAPAALAQYLAIVGALGPSGHAAAVRDGVLRLALGIPAGLDAPAISTWARSVPPHAMETCATVWSSYGAAPDDDALELVLDARFDVPVAFRRLVARMSRALLAALARRLPGFASASPSFLRENVLAFAATVESEPERFVVRMTSPPLGVVLSLTGLNRKRFRLEATGDTEWLLTQAS